MTFCTPDISSSFLLGLDVAAVLPSNTQLHLFALLLLVFHILLVVHVQKSVTALNQHWDHGLEVSVVDTFGKWVTC